MVSQLTAYLVEGNIVIRTKYGVCNIGEYMVFWVHCGF